MAVSLHDFGRRKQRRVFQSTAEFFEFAESFMERLRSEGHTQAAVDLLDGYRCLNGLTDGWALFLEAVEKMQGAVALGLDPRDRADLEALRAAAHKAVYRR
jgi:hypothetical protein